MESNVHASDKLTTDRKAFLINLDRSIYGTFAEIGAGQEVARHFFKVGGAAGTIAKSMSAYDMLFSDEIYGKTKRYVSEDRLLQMLDHEYELLTERLAAVRGDTTRFFVFANTVVAASYNHPKECHGWLGVRFQLQPNTPPNDIIIHIRMLDASNAAQQDALGIVGVNLIYGAFMFNNDVDSFIQSLLDELGNARIEVDRLIFKGPALQHVDNRMLGLKLVHHGLTDAALFGPNAAVLHPSSVIRKKAVLLARGSFRPVTRLHVDMFKCSGAQLAQETAVAGREVFAVMEISLNNLLESGSFDYADFLARVDTITSLGYPVMISDYKEYYRLSAYFRRYTDEMIGIVMGINHLQAIFDDSYYGSLEGGILESFGRLFKRNIKAYIYPMLAENIYNLASNGNVPDNPTITCENFPIETPLKHLFQYLWENGSIEAVRGVDTQLLSIYSHLVMEGIQVGDPSWEESLPESVTAMIKQRKLWGYGAVSANT